MGSGDDDALPFSMHGDDIGKPVAAGLVQRAGGLVEQPDRLIADQHACQAYAALLAARQPVRAPVDQVINPEITKGRHDALAWLRMDVGPDLQALADSLGGFQPVGMAQPGDCIGGSLGCGVISEPDLAAVRADKACDCAQERGLANTIATGQQQGVTRFQREIEIAGQPGLAARQVQPGHGQGKGCESRTVGFAGAGGSHALHVAYFPAKGQRAACRIAAIGMCG